MDSWIWESIKDIPDSERSKCKEKGLYFLERVVKRAISHISELEEHPEYITLQDIFYLKELTDTIGNLVYDNDTQPVLYAEPNKVSPFRVFEVGMYGITGMWRVLLGAGKTKLTLDDCNNLVTEIKLILIEFREVLELVIKEKESENVES